MNTHQHAEEFPEIQAAIYGAALSLDSFLTNGIPNGVIHQALFDEFLQTTAGALLSDVAALEGHVSEVSVENQPKVTQVLGELRAKCQRLIELATALCSFRHLPLQQVLSSVSQIVVLRGECVRLIQELEGYFRTLKPFYQSRPAHSTATMNDFLGNLERIFAEEWYASADNKELNSSLKG